MQNESMKLGVLGILCLMSFSTDTVSAAEQILVSGATGTSMNERRVNFRAMSNVFARSADMGLDVKISTPLVIGLSVGGTDFFDANKSSLTAGIGAAVFLNGTAHITDWVIRTHVSGGRSNYEYLSGQGSYSTVSLGTSLGREWYFDSGINAGLGLGFGYQHTFHSYANSDFSTGNRQYGFAPALLASVGWCL